MSKWEELDINDMPRDILKDGVYEFMNMQGFIVFVPVGSVDRTDLWNMILFDALSGGTVLYRKRELKIEYEINELANSINNELKPLMDKLAKAISGMSK